MSISRLCQGHDGGNIELEPAFLDTVEDIAGAVQKFVSCIQIIKEAATADGDRFLLQSIGLDWIGRAAGAAE